MYIYNYELVEVYDGDTIYIDIDLGFHFWMRNQHIRINLIDTPEIRTTNELEKEAGLLVRDFVKSVLTYSPIKEFKSFGSVGKFGRILGDFTVIYDNKNQTLAQLLFQKGYGNYYTGKAKKIEWTKEKLNKIIKEIKNEPCFKVQTKNI